MGLHDHTNAHAIVAGGAGFIGSHLVRALVERGWRVTVLDNLSSGRRGAVPRSPRVRFRFHDVAHELPTVDPADVIFHLASPAVPADYIADPQAALDTNDLGTRRLIDRALRDRAVLVYASSSEVYGDLDPDLVETIAEDEPARVHLATSRSCYAEAKRFGEELVLAAVRTRGLDARVVRLFNVYGPGMDPNGAARVIPAFVRAALRGDPLTLFGDGSQTRSFCWIDDIIEGLQRLAVIADLHGAVFNLGNPEMIAISDLAAHVIGLVGGGRVTSTPRDPFEPRWRRPDIARANEVLGWAPTVGLAEGLRRVITAIAEETPMLRGVSIVVPTYGRGDKLQRLIAAVEQLRPAPAEVVVVDDASPGGPPSWLASWETAPHAYRARLVRHATNRGPAAARNTGLLHARADLVAFTDDDCEPAPSWVDAISRPLRDREPPIVGVGGIVRARRDDLLSRYYVHQRILEPPSDASYLVTANACFRREMVDAVGGFDERIRQPGGEDPGLCYALAREGFRFSFAPAAVVTHDFRGNLIDFVRTFYRYGKGCGHVAHTWS
jgi:nucleoside-diphosphate-sugar epimerase